MSNIIMKYRALFIVYEQYTNILYLLYMSNILVKYRALFTVYEQYTYI